MNQDVSISTLPPSPRLPRRQGFIRKSWVGKCGRQGDGEESEFKVILQYREFESSLGYVRPCLKKVPKLSTCQFYDFELLL